MTRAAALAFTAAVALLACDGPAPAQDGGETGSATGSATGSETASATAGDEVDAALSFSIEGNPVRSLKTSELIAQIEPVTFTQFDPYYSKPKTFRALPLGAVLKRGFAGKNLVLEEQHFVLRASDGYTVPVAGKRLMEDGAHIALDDLDVSDGWQPIGPQQVDPGPFYLVWSKREQQDLTTHPRPWQLASIEVSRFENSFPKVVPEGADDAAQRGFAIFREQCIRCHSINQQGGKVGPDLNVPQSVVEYRDPQQLKAYIKNPRTFRYGKMPENPHLSDANLDELLAYFRAMSQRKDDPGKPQGEH